MRKKLCLLFLVAVVALASMGISYANGSVDFVYCEAWDEEPAGKDTGMVFADYSTGDLVVTVLCGYPGYVAYVDFTMENTYTTTGYMTISVNNPNPAKVDIVVIDSTTDLPFPADAPITGNGGRLYGTLEITVKSGAEESKAYPFTVDIDFSEEEPPAP